MGTDTVSRPSPGQAIDGHRERDARPPRGGYRTPPQEHLITYKQDATPQDRNDGTKRHGMTRDDMDERKHEERDKQDETRRPDGYPTSESK